MFLSGESSFKEFIYQELSQADQELSFEIKNYISELLWFYLFSKHLFESENNKGCFYQTTMVDFCHKIGEAETHEKIYYFKKMGDLTLYLSGFFRPAMKKKSVPISYYENMGQSAYAYLSHCYKGETNVFHSLSKKFKTLAEILSYIQKKSGEHTEDRLVLFQGASKS